MTEPVPEFDLYRMLGVPRDTPPNAVIAAHRGLIRRVHPDVSSDPDSAERSKLLNIARDWLVDPARRARYDAVHPAPANNGHRAALATAPHRDRSGSPESAWRAELVVFVARCRNLTRVDRVRLVSEADHGRSRREIAGRAERLAVERGRVVQVEAAAAAATLESRLAPRRGGRDQRVIELFRQIALGLALADIAPLDAQILTAAWRHAVWEPDLRARERRRKVARVKRVVRRLLEALALGVLAVLTIVGGLVAVAVLFGWAG
jgi:hypothetical protein